MKKLLNTLYVTSPDTYLALDGENIVIRREEQEIARVPLHNMESILAFGRTGASPALMGACAKRGIALSFLTPSGRFLARISGEERGNVTLRKTQYRISEDVGASLGIAKSFITGKLYNARWVLERATRDHSDRVNVLRLKNASAEIAACLRSVPDCADAGSLRGVEGVAAAIYFDVFDELILRQKETFRFDERNRRPPLDPVNALLSFAYTLLAHDVAAALEGVGLDPYVGFFHTDRPGRASLAVDLMEELRASHADRFVLSLINRKIIQGNDLVCKETRAWLLEDDARKKVLAAWQERKQDTVVHPFLEEKMAWGLVPYAQAMLLARYIRGDLDAYPPFFWK